MFILEFNVKRCIKWNIHDNIFSSKQKRRIAFKFDISNEWFCISGRYSPCSARKIIADICRYVGANEVEVCWFDDVADKNPILCFNHKCCYYVFSRTIKEDGVERRIFYDIDDLSFCSSAEWRIKNIVDIYKQSLGAECGNISDILNKAIEDLQQALVGHNEMQIL